jgi:SepF-like predicted cell division protein (DUF552 family)
MVFRLFKRGFRKPSESEYIEIDIGKETKKQKVVVRPFVLRNFEDINKIVNTLREGYAIVVVDIAPLKGKDVVDLRRAISKLKKTCDALEGDIAGFGESIVIATPNFAEVYKGEKIEKVEQ